MPVDTKRPTNTIFQVFFCAMVVCLILFYNKTALMAAHAIAGCSVIFYGIYFLLFPYYTRKKSIAIYGVGALILSGGVFAGWQAFNFADAATLFFRLLLIIIVIAFAHALAWNANRSRPAAHDFELNMLKSQFNPHFLFNILNIIYAKCHTTSPEAAAMIQKLSAFMRYLINDCSKDRVLLQKEVTMIHDYIQLYKLNYNDRLNITFKHKLYDEGVKIAPLILLNFVENAFKHSHIAVKQNAFVVIELATDQSHLHFKVCNNKAPAINQMEKGIGNNITLRQLELAYGNNYEYKVTESETEYEVYLKIRL